MSMQSTQAFPVASEPCQDGTSGLQSCDALTTQFQSLLVPWYNSSTGKLDMVQLTTTELFDRSQGVNAFYPTSTAAIIQMISSLSLRLRNLFDPNTFTQTTLTDGDNPIADINLVAVHIEFDDPLPPTDLWYGSKIIRKLGVFMWGFPSQFEEIRFINSRDVWFFSPQGTTYDGCFLNLPPGARGTITTFAGKQLSPNQSMQIALDGGVNYSPYVCSSPQNGLDNVFVQ